MPEKTDEYALVLIGFKVYHPAKNVFKVEPWCRNVDFEFHVFEGIF
jgi:hypothetical protein